MVCAYSLLGPPDEPSKLTFTFRFLHLFMLYFILRSSWNFYSIVQMQWAQPAGGSLAPTRLIVARLAKVVIAIVATKPIHAFRLKEACDAALANPRKASALPTIIF